MQGRPARAETVWLDSPIRVLLRPSKTGEERGDHRSSDRSSADDRDSDRDRRPDLPLAVCHGRAHRPERSPPLRRPPGRQLADVRRQRRDRGGRGLDLALRTLLADRRGRPAASGPVGDAQFPPPRDPPPGREHALPLGLRDRGRGEARAREILAGLPADRDAPRGVRPDPAPHFGPEPARGRCIGRDLRPDGDLHDLGPPERALHHGDPHRGLPHLGLPVGTLLHDGRALLHGHPGPRVRLLGGAGRATHVDRARPPLGRPVGGRRRRRDPQGRARRLRRLGPVLALGQAEEARGTTGRSAASGSTIPRGSAANAGKQGPGRKRRTTTARPGATKPSRPRPCGRSAR